MKGAVDKLTASLKDCCEQLQLSINQTQIEQVLRYIELLVKWNKVYNLTAVRDPLAIMSRHICDSLSIVPYVKGPRVLDVGSGAGLPGIPLAIYYPRLRFVLVDSLGKRTRFLQQICSELGLSHVEVVQSRVETLQDKLGFNSIVVRAFGSIDVIMGKVSHLLAVDGQLLIMKGTYPHEELQTLAGRDHDVIELQVPGLEGKRHLVRL